MEPNFRLIGMHIKDCRSCKNITQAILAERAGLSIPYISQVETAQKHISLHALISIADALGITVDWLLRGSQGADFTSYTIGLEQLLEDCTLYERNIIVDSALALKKAFAITNPSFRMSCQINHDKTPAGIPDPQDWTVRNIYR